MEQTLVSLHEVSQVILTLQ